MITLEQIQLLEEKVHQTVNRITALKEENSSLKEKLSTYSGRIEELEVLIDSFKQDQGKIEEGILSALKQLDTIEQSVAVENGSAVEAEASTPSPSPAPEQDRTEKDAKTEVDEDVSKEAELDIF